MQIYKNIPFGIFYLKKFIQINILVIRFYHSQWIPVLNKKRAKARSL